MSIAAQLQVMQESMQLPSQKILRTAIFAAIPSEEMKMIDYVTVYNKRGNVDYLKFLRSVMKDRAGRILYSSSPPAAALDAARFLALRPGGPWPYGELVEKSMCFSEAVRTLKDGTLTSWFPTRMWR